MESTSEAMKIQISEATQRLLDEKTDERRRSLTDYGIGLAQNMNSPKFITQLRDKVNIHFMSLLLSDDLRYNSQIYFKKICCTFYLFIGSYST